MNTKIDIVLVNPPLTLEKRTGNLHKAGNTLPSLGILSLAAVLRENKYNSAIIEAASHQISIEKTVDMILSYDPYCVGVTSTTLSIATISIIAELLKKTNPSIKIIVGGPHITAVPKETMEKFPGIDIGVIGEGEETIVELMKALRDNTDLERIAGIIFRKNGRPFITEARERIRDLDKISFPAWDMLPDFPEGYKSAAYKAKRSPCAGIVTSRGCPGKCIFCDRSVFGNVYRRMSAERILEQFVLLRERYGVKDILIYDDAFTTSKDNVSRFCKLLIAKRLDVVWSCVARVDFIDNELLTFMKKSGCWRIDYGIESGSQKILNKMGKNITLKQIETAVKLTKKHGIKVTGYFILGSFLETHKTIRETIDFAIKLPLDNMHTCYFTPFPGSKAHETANAYGSFGNDWDKMSLCEISFVPNGLKVGDLRKYSAEIIRKFYMQPRIIFDYILALLRNPSMLLNYFRGFEAVLKVSKNGV